MCVHTDTYTNKHKQIAFKVEGVVEITGHLVLGEEGCEFCLLRASCNNLSLSQDFSFQTSSLPPT